MSEKNKLHKRTSEIIAEVIANSKGNGDISVQEVLELLGHKSFCLVILVLALPNCFPIPNLLAYSALTGIPIMLLAIQMIVGRNTLWLPHAITNRKFSRTKFANVLAKLLPYIKKIESVFYPRMFFIRINIAERLFGVVFLLLAIVLSLPIPFGNMIPGFAIAFMAIGLMERDGLMLTAGLIFVVFSSAAIFTAIKTILLAM